MAFITVILNEKEVRQSLKCSTIHTCSITAIIICLAFQPSITVASM